MWIEQINAIASPTVRAASPKPAPRVPRVRTGNTVDSHIEKIIGMMMDDCDKQVTTAQVALELGINKDDARTRLKKMVQCGEAICLPQDNNQSSIWKLK